MTPMPEPAHLAIDQRPLNGEGRWAWRHELSVLLPGALEATDEPDPFDAPEGSVSWFELSGGVTEPCLTVVAYSPNRVPEPGLLEALSGELAEEWVKATGRLSV